VPYQKSTSQPATLTIHTFGQQRAAPTNPAADHESPCLCILCISKHHKSSDLGAAAAPQVLNMARNSLIALPPEVSCLTNLTELDVGRNQLTALPATLCSLSQLQVRMQHLMAAAPAAAEAAAAVLELLPPRWQHCLQHCAASAK
jgi:hypothetical protein